MAGFSLSHKAKASLLMLFAASLYANISTAASKESTDPINVCEVVNLSGDFAAYNIPKMQALKLAISELNEQGGVLGRRLELTTFDAQSDVTRNKKLVQKCIFTAEPDVIFGGYTESSLDAIAPVVQKHKTLFWLTNQGTQGYAWKHTFYTSPMADQQIIPGIEYMIKEFGPRMYVVAADYSFGHNSVLWTEVAAKKFNGNIVGKSFVPLGHSSFTSIIPKIKQANPDFLVLFLVGSAQSQFYPQSYSAGISEIPKLSTTNLQQGYEHKLFTPPTLENLHVPVAFLEEIENTHKPAQQFVSAIRTMFPDMPYVNQAARGTYVAMHMTAKAWEQAGTTDTAATIKALESGLTFDAPEGQTKMNGCTHMLMLEMRMARVNHDHSISFVKNLGQIDPDWMTEDFDVCLKNSDPSRKFVPTDDKKFQQLLGTTK